MPLPPTRAASGADAAPPLVTSTCPAAVVVQVAWLVTSEVVESAKVARAVSGRLEPPAVTSPEDGVTATDTTTGSTTVTEREAWVEPAALVAVTV